MKQFNAFASKVVCDRPQSTKPYTISDDAGGKFRDLKPPFAIKRFGTVEKALNTFEKVYGEPHPDRYADLQRVIDSYGGISGLRERLREIASESDMLEEQIRQSQPLGFYGYGPSYDSYGLTNTFVQVEDI